ncbi:glucosamine-6-phosphate deaminase [Macrococcus equipercicus]|uniref:Glucosamine-6-phosphate deaminase n=1 Tax=Macrococcus equipercicus TaxID=69967 RepID=A0A9Q9F1P7_9STAP|nr:glucosamine-6-phosphate deaminase [Macrococcus equipercicus]KAA1039644.1 glucosamine-6-phosphate deaminase [Macrococcus equipercicus]UTH13975.1 glucosamine-6-phosphate deaminase [Macrococcus equipercicus]
MRFINLGSRQDAAHYTAIEMFKEIHYNHCTLLGLATGGTMEEVYAKLVELLTLNHTDITCLETFNLDEYFMLDQNDPNSYMSYMRAHFFDKIGMQQSQFHLPDNDGIDVEEDNEAYDRAIREKGPLHLQLLGIGENGHIGFNEPGTPFDSKTRLVELTETTIAANSRYFDNEDDVPTKAISMGIDTILYSKRIILLALGEKKADIMAKLYAMSAPDESIPASSLLNHPNVEIVMDDAAACKIDRTSK